MKIAVDTCVGHRGVALLRSAGHEVVTQAEHGEPDRTWFARARGAGAEVVVSPDADIEILCYDYAVPFFRARQGDSDADKVARLLRWIAHRR